MQNVITDVEESEEMEDHLEKINIKFSQMFPIRTTMQPVSNTLMRKKEDVAARTLQTAWRNFKTQEVNDRKLDASYSSIPFIVHDVSLSQQEQKLILPFHYYVYFLYKAVTLFAMAFPSNKSYFLLIF